MTLTPGRALAQWFDRLQGLPLYGPEGEALFSAERWEQAAGAIRRLEASDDLGPILNLLAEQCDLMAELDRNLDPERDGG